MLENMPQMSLTQVFVPVFLIFICVDYYASAKSPTTRRYDGKDTIMSLSLGLMSVISGAVLGEIFSSFLDHVSSISMLKISAGISTFAICLILDDFCFYWYHRSSHKIRWFWASHVVHHSSEFLNFATAGRQPWLFFLAPSIIFRAPLVVIGFDPLMVLLVGSANMTYQFFIHTERISKLPSIIEYLLNTPSHHRVHHATDDQYLDRNFGGVLIIWDRLFGTFCEEDSARRPTYGIVGHLDRSNVLWVSCHEWVSLFRDVARAPWNMKFSCAFGAPRAHVQLDT